MAGIGSAFGPFVFDPVEWRLTRDGEPIALQDKALGFLAALLERPGGLWRRDELFARLWPGVFVTDDALFQLARKVRAALDDDPRQPRWIETVAGRGYRFVGAVTPAAPRPQPAAAPDAPPVAPRAATPPPRPRVGREDLLARIRDALLAGPGLWTLTGPGGVGKTSLALALIPEVEAALEGGALICDAAEITTSDGLQAAVARTLGLDRAAAEQPEAVAHALEGLGPALLVIDNLEQVAEPAAALLAGWSARAGALRLLATSRVRLGARGERLVDVPPLSLPEAEDLDALRASSAGALLLKLAAEVADRVIAPEDAPALTRMVEALGGLPLAIELAAPRLRVLSPTQLLARMARQLDLLRGGAPDRPTRHAALRSTIATSWALLQPFQQAAACQLAQLGGPFPADAAEAVLDLAAWPQAGDPLDVLGALVDHSLVRRRDPGSAQGLPALLELLPSIREYAREVADPALALAAQERVARWYADPGCFAGPADLAAVRAQRERTSLGAALDQAVARGQAALAAGLVLNLSWTLLAHGPLGEATARLAAVGAMAGLPDAQRARLRLREAEAWLAGADPRPAARLLDEAATLLGADEAGQAELRCLRCESAYRAGDLARARALADLALADATLPDAPRARLLTLRAGAELTQGQLRDGQATLQQALALVEAGDLRDLRVRVVLELGWATMAQGRLTEALAWWDAAYAQGVALGDRQIQARALERRGQALRSQGRLTEAEAELRAAVVLFQRGGFPLLEGGCLDQLASIAMHQGRIEVAEARFRQGIALLEASRHGLAAAVSRGNLATLYARVGRLDEAHAELCAVLEQQRTLGGNTAVTLHNLGRVTLYRGDPAGARARVEQALALHEAEGRALAAAFARGTLGQILLV